MSDKHGPLIDKGLRGDAVEAKREGAPVPPDGKGFTDVEQVWDALRGE